MTEKTDIRDSDEKVVEIEMELLRTFTNHPFKVISDSQMIELQDSIKKYGVLNPLIVRPRKEGYYEIISGHRRKYVAERLGYKKIPVIIRMMQDHEAVVTMVDSNLQRGQITPSEKAYAYKYLTFHNHQRSVRQAVGFAVNILLCYAFAFSVAKPLVIRLMANVRHSVQENVSMLVGMGLFSCCNYLGQRLVVFREVGDT